MWESILDIDCVLDGMDPVVGCQIGSGEHCSHNVDNGMVWLFFKGILE